MAWLIVAGILISIIAGGWITMEHGSLAFFRLPKGPKPGQIRVACAGDSITYGYGVRNWTKNQYPVQLGKMLGEGYCVRNFGVCGATASAAGDCPYVQTMAYRQSLAFKPDIVLLMLGTNDSKPANYRGAAAYGKDMQRLISSFRALDSRPKVILLTPPPAWGDPVPFTIDARVIEQEIRPALIALAQKENAPCIDVFAAFDGKRELLWDGVHPNGDGAKRMAEIIAAYLKQEKQA